jgi:general secretion pathway protein G
LKRQRGTTFVELMAAAAIMIILAGTILPLARVTIKRQREMELRHALREMRTAIDEFKRTADSGGVAPMDLKAGAEGYPAELATLVKGVSLVAGTVSPAGQINRPDRKRKFLRRIPMDPMTRSTEWGTRCYQDEPDSRSSCGDNVYDVYTKSEGKALDGTKYKDW